MKKYCALLVAITYVLTCQAQLRVFSSGNVNIGDSSNYQNCHLTLADSSATRIPYSLNNSVKAGVTSFVNPTNSFNYGVLGTSLLTNSTLTNKKNYGVYGLAGSPSTSQYNYGVYGCLMHNGNGAAVFGTISNVNGIDVNGKYAAYFNGDAYVTGTATIINLVQPSDERLKDDIIYLSDNRSDIHSRMMDVDVISYRYKPYFFTKESAEEMKKYEKADRRIHFGVSAQQIHELFPELVTEGQDGYLAVNYQELVPMLICSVQQLQKELDELKSVGNNYKGLPQTTNIDVLNTKSRSILYQNTPNPLKEKTTLRFKLSDDAKDAFVCIFDMTGKQLKKMPVSQGMDSVSINGYELGEGIFLYSLIVNGLEIDTKRMIVSK